MSNKTQLQTNNTALDGYITRINAAKEVAAGLPEAGSGVENIETCTVTLTVPKGIITYTTTNETNDIISSYATPENDVYINSLYITNIICNTYITYISGSSTGVNITLDKAELIYGTTGNAIIKVTASANEEASIKIAAGGGSFD